MRGSGAGARPEGADPHKRPRLANSHIRTGAAISSNSAVLGAPGSSQGAWLKNTHMEERGSTHTERASFSHGMDMERKRGGGELELRRRDMHTEGSAAGEAASRGTNKAPRWRDKHTEGRENTCSGKEYTSNGGDTAAAGRTSPLRLPGMGIQGEENNTSTERSAGPEAAAVARRQTRVRSQRVQGRERECEQRRGGGALCEAACGCPNSLPTLDQQKVWVDRALGGVEQQGLYALQTIEAGEVITIFGDTLAVGPQHGGQDLQRLCRAKESDPKEHQLTYTLEKNVNGQETYCFVPKQDQDRLKQEGHAGLLKKILKAPRGPAGVGEFANHCCCGTHRNAELTPRLYVAGGETEIPVVCVVATKRIPKKAEILVAYVEDKRKQKLPFDCRCCECAGPCGKTHGAAYRSTARDNKRVPSKHVRGREGEGTRSMLEWLAPTSQMCMRQSPLGVGAATESKRTAHGDGVSLRASEGNSGSTAQMAGREGGDPSGSGAVRQRAQTHRCQHHCGRETKNSEMDADDQMRRSRTWPPGAVARVAQAQPSGTTSPTQTNSGGERKKGRGLARSWNEIALPTAEINMRAAHHLEWLVNSWAKLQSSTGAACREVEGEQLVVPDDIGQLHGGPNLLTHGRLECVVSITADDLQRLADGRQTRAEFLDTMLYVQLLAWIRAGSQGADGVRLWTSTHAGMPEVSTQAAANRAAAGLMQWIVRRCTRDRQAGQVFRTSFDANHFYLHWMRFMPGQDNEIRVEVYAMDGLNRELGEGPEAANMKRNLWHMLAREWNRDKVSQAVQLTVSYTDVKVPKQGINNCAYAVVDLVKEILRHDCDPEQAFRRVGGQWHLCRSEEQEGAQYQSTRRQARRWAWGWCRWAATADGHGVATGTPNDRKRPAPQSTGEGSAPQLLEKHLRRREPLDTLAEASWITDVPLVSKDRTAVLYPPAKDGGRSSEELAVEVKGSMECGTGVALGEERSARALHGAEAADAAAVTAPGATTTKPPAGAVCRSEDRAQGWPPGQALGLGETILQSDTEANAVRVVTGPGCVQAERGERITQSAEAAVGAEGQSAVVGTPMGHQQQASRGSSTTRPTQDRRRRGKNRLAHEQPVRVNGGRSGKSGGCRTVARTPSVLEWLSRAPQLPARSPLAGPSCPRQVAPTGESIQDEAAKVCADHAQRTSASAHGMAECGGSSDLGSLARATVHPCVGTDRQPISGAAWDRQVPPVQGVSVVGSAANVRGARQRPETGHGPLGNTVGSSDVQQESEADGSRKSTDSSAPTAMEYEGEADEPDCRSKVHQPCAAAKAAQTRLSGIPPTAQRSAGTRGEEAVGTKTRQKYGQSLLPKLQEEPRLRRLQTRVEEAVVALRERSQQLDGNGQTEIQASWLEQFWRKVQRGRLDKAPGTCWRCGGPHLQKQCPVPSSEPKPLGARQPPVQDIAQMYQEGRRFVQEHLKPWALRWRQSKGTQNWNQIQDKQVVELVIGPISAQGERALTQGLSNMGVTLNEMVAGQQPKRTDARGQVITQGLQVKVTVQVNEALRDLLYSQQGVTGDENEPLRIIARDSDTGSLEDLRVMHSELFTESDCEKERLREMVQIFRQLGAGEADLMALIEANVERVGQQVAVKADDTEQGRALDVPVEVRQSDGRLGQERARLQDVWRGASNQGVIVLQSPCPWAGAALEQYTKMRSIDGDEGTDFLNRRADILNTARATGVLSAKALGSLTERRPRVWLGLPNGGSTETVPEETSGGPTTGDGMADMVAAAPAWLRQVGGFARWRPSRVCSLHEQESAVCIRFRQNRTVEQGPRITRAGLRTALRNILDIVRRAAFPQSPPVTMEEVDVAAYWTEPGHLLGMITMCRAAHRELEEQTWLGTVLAFCVGNRSKQEDRRHLKWCPREQRLGSSSCVLSEAHYAVCHGHTGRRHIRLKDLFGEGGWLGHQAMRLLAGKGREQHPLQSLRVFAKGGHSGQRQAKTDEEHLWGGAPTTSEFWVQRAPNRLRLAGTGDPPSIATLQTALEWEPTVLTGHYVKSTEDGWVALLTLADPAVCMQLLAQHQTQPKVVGGQAISLQLVPWGHRVVNPPDKRISQEARTGTSAAVTTDLQPGASGLQQQPLADQPHQVQTANAQTPQDLNTQIRNRVREGDAAEHIAANAEGERLGYWQRQKWAYCSCRGMGPRQWVRQGKWECGQARDWERMAVIFRVDQGQTVVSGRRWRAQMPGEVPTGCQIAAGINVLRTIRLGKELTWEERGSVPETWIFRGDWLRDGDQVWIADEGVEDQTVADFLRRAGYTITAQEHDIWQSRVGLEPGGGMAHTDGTATAWWWHDDRRGQWNRYWTYEVISRWQRQPVGGNVATWNVGGASILQVLRHIQGILARGVAILFLQEIKFPLSDRRVIKKALEQLSPNYVVHMARGREMDSMNEEGKDPAKCWAVATFLHREAFKTGKTVTREWAQSLQRQGIERVGRGRVQWLETVTAEGKAIWIANLHQIAGRDLQARQQILLALQSRIATKAGQLGILGGDFNAAELGGRANLARGSVGFVQEADAQLATFLQLAGGQLITARTATRVGQRKHDLTESGLDHIAVWGMGDINPGGRTEWVGEDGQDHAQVFFRIRPDLLGDCRVRTPALNSDPVHSRVTGIRDIETDLNRITETRGEQLLHLTDTGQLDTEQAMLQCLAERQQAARDIKQDRCSTRVAHRPGRLAHRSKEQNTLRRALVATDTTLRLKGGDREILGVELACLRQLDLGDLEQQWSRQQLGCLLQLPEWKKAVSCLRDWQSESLEALTELQLQIQKRRFEQEEWKQCQGGQGGLQWFTGKKRTPPPQPKLKLTVLTGGLWLEPSVGSETSEHVGIPAEVEGQRADATILEWESGTPYLLLRRSEEDREEIAAALKGSLQSRPTLWGQTWVTCTEEEARRGNLIEAERLCQLLREGHTTLNHDSIPLKEWLMIGSSSVAQGATGWLRPVGAEIAEGWGGSPGPPTVSLQHYDTADMDVWIVQAKTQEAERALWVWALTVHQHVSERTTATKTSLEWRWVPEGSRLVGAEAHSLQAVLPLLRQVDGRTTQADWRKPLLRNGPWEGLDKTIAWELYFQKEGYSPHAECDEAGCGQGGPRMVIQMPVQSGGKVDRELTESQRAGNLGPDLGQTTDSIEQPQDATGVQGCSDRCSDSPRDEKWTKQQHGRSTRRWDEGVRHMQEQFEDEQRRRVVRSFCSRCWKCTSFRGNARMVKDTAFMDRLKIFQQRTAVTTDLRLRKELEASEWANIIRDRLRWGVAPGPDTYSTDLVKTMSEPEKEILRRWVNEVLTTGRETPAREVEAAIRNGTISLLHKDGDTTDLPGDWRPVVLLNTVSQHLLTVFWRRGCGASQKNATSLSLARRATGSIGVQTSICAKCSTSRTSPIKKGSRCSDATLTSAMPSIACHRPRSGPCCEA